MESILGLDLTKTPAQAILIRIENGAVTVAAQKTIDVGQAFSRAALSQGLAPTKSAEAPMNDGSPNPEPEINLALPENAAQSIRELPIKWDRAAVLAPAHDILSLNLSLPFSDAKNITRVLGLEVQDRVPFDIDSFLLNHSVVGADREAGNDVYVSGASRAWIAKTIATCRELEVEPSVITTAGSLISAIELVSSEKLSGPEIFIVRAGQNLHVVLTIDGKPHSERIIESPEADRLSPSSAAEIRIALSALEKRYSVEVGRVYILASDAETQAIQDSLQRECAAPQLTPDLGALPHEARLAFLTALLAKEDSAPAPLSNFRSGDFSYNPKIGEVLRALRALAPQIVLAVLAGAAFLIGSYAYRSLEIDNLRDNMHEQISRIVPNLDSQNGKDIEAVAQARTAMETELKALGSPARIRPLDALIEISKDLAAKADANLTGLAIKDGKMYLDITVADYSSVDQLERTLKRNTDYCKVDKRAGASQTFGKERAFKLEITLCP